MARALGYFSKIDKFVISDPIVKMDQIVQEIRFSNMVYRPTVCKTGERSDMSS